MIAAGLVVIRLKKSSARDWVRLVLHRSARGRRDTAPLR